MRTWRKFSFTVLAACISGFGISNSLAAESTAVSPSNPISEVLTASNGTNGNGADSTLPVETTTPQADPLESFNRVMYGFNDNFDHYFLKPISELYTKIMPKPLAKGVANVYNNLDTVPTVLNDVLQANFYQAVNDTWRLGVNTTVGIGGLFDVASHIGLEPNVEDFGLTLARWGWANSTYIVLPLMGPSTFRDGIGFPVNYYGLSVYPYIKPRSVQYGVYGLGVVSHRADLLHYEEVMDSIAIDRYIFMRDAYLQRRNYLIERNKELSNPYLEKSTAEEVAQGKIDRKVQEQTKPFSSI